MEPVILTTGQVLPPELLCQVDELHALVRKWAEAGSKTGKASHQSRNPTVEDQG